MGFAFNPFTGTFDVKGAGGGGGSAFFAGEVPTYADLPLDGTAALNSRWLVRSNSGTWPFSSYKQAGVYVRIATVGSSRDNDYRLTDTSFHDVMSDAAFLIYDDGDATRNLKFQLSGIDTATTRTLTVPNASGRIQVEGQPIGNTTPAAGSFTTLSASTSLTLGTSGILSGGTNTIEQRNTTSGQTFRIYNTVSGTADANYERGFMRWSSNILQIGSEKLGTGSARALEFQTDGTTRASISSGGSLFTLATGCALGFSSRVVIEAEADGNIRFRDWGNTGAIFLRIGGSTTSFPALKRSSTALQVRLADDSAFAPFACAGLTLNGDLTASTRNIVTDTTTGTKIGTGTTQLLGFWNATPVAQQSSTGTNATGFTANGPGNTVHADSTFTGNVGATAYSISDIVKHLKTIGLIAS